MRRVQPYAGTPSWTRALDWRSSQARQHNTIVQHLIAQLHKQCLPPRMHLLTQQRRSQYRRRKQFWLQAALHRLSSPTYRSALLAHMRWYLQTVLGPLHSPRQHQAQRHMLRRQLPLRLSPPSACACSRQMQHGRGVRSWHCMAGCQPHIQELVPGGCMRSPATACRPASAWSS